MLPGKADTSVHLDIQFRIVHVGGHRSSRGYSGRELHLRRVGSCRRSASSVPGCRCCELYGNEHVGAVVFDRLKHSDGATELLALLGVGNRIVKTATCAAHGFGAGQNPGQCGGLCACTRNHVVRSQSHASQSDQ